MRIVPSNPPPNCPEGRIFVVALEQANILVNSRETKYMPANNHLPNFFRIRLTITDARVRINIDDGLERRANGEDADHNP